MMTEELIDSRDEAKWHKYLPASRTVFGSVEFARISERFSGNDARLLVVQHDGVAVAYPFQLRRLCQLPFTSACHAADCDTITPEYTGPFASAPVDKHPFLDRVHEVFGGLGGVAEFIHLNPWSDGKQLLDPNLLHFNREIVWVDVTLSNEELWRDHFSQACRKNINRANREQVRIVEAQGSADIREFHRIYIGTMDRNHASQSYFFPLEYFEAIFEQLPQHARFVLAEYKGRVIAGTLYLHDDQNVYSYLGGADYESQQIRPTNAIVYDTIGWARTRAKRRLVLGGGYRPEDGIFRFKSSFSPLRAAFHTYRRVHRPELYLALQQEWQTYYGLALPDTGYFPAYRSAPPTDSILTSDSDIGIKSPGLTTE